MPVSRRVFGKVHGNRIRKLMLADEKKEEPVKVEKKKKPSKKKGLKKLFSRKVKKNE